MIPEDILAERREEEEGRKEERGGRREREGGRMGSKSFFFFTDGFFRGFERGFLSGGGWVAVCKGVKGDVQLFLLPFFFFWSLCWGLRGGEGVGGWKGGRVGVSRAYEITKSRLRFSLMQARTPPGAKKESRASRPQREHQEEPRGTSDAFFPTLSQAFSPLSPLLGFWGDL